MDTLTSDGKGNLYGVAVGSVYQLTPSDGGWTYTTIYSFQSVPDGIGPDSLVIDEAGNLYGTTVVGGASTNCRGGCGTVFKLTHRKSGWHETVLHSFQV